MWLPLLFLFIRDGLFVRSDWFCCFLLSVKVLIFSKKTTKLFLFL